MKQIPGNDHAQAEGARQAIREKYATLQAQMDAAQTADELKALLPE
jgi:predicted  nucleic acid-binding Zn-ribbon protein